MKFHKFVVLLIVFISLGTMAARASGTSPQEASKFINTLANHALKVLSAEKLTLEEREAEVRVL